MPPISPLPPTLMLLQPKIESKTEIKTKTHIFFLMIAYKNVGGGGRIFNERALYGTSEAK
jgi:hypothetical protein